MSNKNEQTGNTCSNAGEKIDALVAAVEALSNKKTNKEKIIDMAISSVPVIIGLAPMFVELFLNKNDKK